MASGIESFTSLETTQRWGAELWRRAASFKVTIWQCNLCFYMFSLLFSTVFSLQRICIQIIWLNPLHFLISFWRKEKSQIKLTRSFIFCVMQLLFLCYRKLSKTYDLVLYKMSLSSLQEPLFRGKKKNKGHFLNKIHWSCNRFTFCGWRQAHMGVWCLTAKLNEALKNKLKTIMNYINLLFL